MRIKPVSKSNHLVRWFGAHWTGLMITRRRHHVIDRTTAGQKEIEKATGKGLPCAILLSSLCGVLALKEHRLWKPIGRSVGPASRRVVGATPSLPLFVGVRSPLNSVYIVLFSADMQVILQKCTNVYFQQHFSNISCSCAACQAILSQILRLIALSFSEKYDDGMPVPSHTRQLRRARNSYIPLCANSVV